MTRRRRRSPLEVAAAAKAAAGSDVAFDKVSVAYRGAVVLKPLTLEVAAGEILAMIGPSGSGKTTALRAVAGFVRPAARAHPHRRNRRDEPAAL